MHIFATSVLSSRFPERKYAKKFFSQIKKPINFSNLSSHKNVYSESMWLYMALKPSHVAMEIEIITIYKNITKIQY